MKLFKKFNKKGFTLFELLAVMAILAIIAGIAVPRVLATIQTSRINSIVETMNMYANAGRRIVIEAQIASNDISALTLDATNDTTFGSGTLADYVESIDGSDYIIYITSNGTVYVEYIDEGYEGVAAADVASASDDIAAAAGADTPETGVTVTGVAATSAILKITP